MTDILSKPIIVVGSARSGTSFLGNILSTHPDLYYLKEPRLTWRYGNDTKSDRLTSADATPQVCDYIRNEFATRAKKQGGLRILEKSPSNSLRLEFVDQVFPDAKFVHIIRDGTQSVLSIYRFWKDKSRGLPTKQIGARLKELSITRLPYYSFEVLKRVLPQGAAYWTGQPVWGPRIPGLNGLLRDLDLLEVCCLQWRMCVEAACTYGRLLPATRYMECRLEDMSPELLQRVMEFTELEDASEIWEAFEKKFDPSQPGRRTPNAEPAQIELIHKWIEPTMKWLESGNSVPSPGESSPGRG